MWEGGESSGLAVSETSESPEAYWRSASPTHRQEIAAPFKNVKAHNYKDNWRTG